MRQLTSLDTQFLALESARQTGHVGSLAILDPSTVPGGALGLTDMQDLVTERLPLLPPLRWTLAEVPLGLDYPYWVDDLDFDVEYHVRELALPAPGNDDQLSDQVARIMARPLDRARPLWELYLIHGLEHGYVAMLTKIHHALIDGMSGAEIMGLLLDLEPEGRELPDSVGVAGGERAPSDLEMLGRGLAGLPLYPLRALRALPRALPNIEDTPFATLPGAGLHRPSRRPRADRRPARILSPGAQPLRGAQDDVQRPHLGAPALRLRAPPARRRQGGQERPRLHRQRRDRLDVRRRRAALARRARRAARGSARRADPGVGAHR